MRVGILTFHEAASYGAALQAYALQTVLEQLGAETEFVSFKKSPAKESEFPANPMVRRLRAEAEKREKKFVAFRCANLHISEPFNKSVPEAIDARYDRFVAGSDQIWNFRIPEADERYFLPFADKQKRYSYAASFGVPYIPEKARAWCAKQLSDFAGLSVREESGRTLIKQLTGRDALVCPDPTMLLNRTDWDQIAKPVSGPPYALLFVLQYNEALALSAAQWAKAHDVPLRVVTAAFMPRFGMDAWSGVGVEEWLGLIAHAEAVFTNSFHGAVFSLLYGRPLSAELLNGELQDRNGRIVELLEMTGMKDCVSSAPKTITEERLEESLREKRAMAQRYLKEIVAG